MVHRIRIGVFPLIAFVILFSLDGSDIFAQTVQKKHTSLKKRHHTVVHKYSSKRKHHKHHKDSLAHGRPQLQRHYPPPGSSGEDRNFDWLRNRAYPNEFIDPSSYPNALEEARRLPVYGSASRNGIQAAMPWQQIGPFTIGGRVTAIATHPTDSNTFYVGAAAGGLWKTTDHGNSWQALTDTFAALSIGCITIDPHDPNTIYIGMGECNGSADSYPGNGLWRSLDGGISWTNLGLVKTQYISKVIIDPLDKNTIYVCAPGPTNSADSNRGIWKSTNAGASWSSSLIVRAGKTKTSTPVPSIDLVMNPADHTDLVTASWQPINSLTSTNLQYTGLWRSRDAGASWIRIDTIAGSGYLNGINFKRLSRVSLLWVLNNKGVPTLYSVVASVDKDPLTGYNVADNFYGLYKTTNPESGWQKVLDSTYRLPFLGNNIDSVNLFNRQGGYDNLIISNPRHADEIYIGGIDVIRSTDGGSSWENITKAYPHYFANDRTQHSDMHALAFTAASSGDDLLNGQDGGVFNTRNFGTSWTQLKGLPITMFYHLEPWAAGMADLPSTFPADSLKLFGGTQDNGSVARGFSANSDWDWINRGDGGEAQADPNNKDHIITSLQLGKIFFRTTLDSLRPNLFSDAGNLDPNAKKWFDLSVIAKRRGITDSSEACAFIPPVLLDKKNGTDLYTGKSFIYHAKLDFMNPDSGTVITRWSPQVAGLPGNPKGWYYGEVDAMALGVRDAQNRPMIWAAGKLNSSRVIWRTTLDENRPLDSMPRWIRVEGSASNGSVLAVLSPSWIVADRSDSLTALISFSGFNPLNKNGIDTMGHLFKTIDGGKKWIRIGLGLPNAPIDAFVIDSLAETSDPLTKNQCIIVAMDVGVFVTTDGGKTWSQLGTGMPHLVVGSLTMYKNWLIAGTHGRSAWALDVSSLQAVPLNAVSEKPVAGNEFTIRSIYPSPIDLRSSAAIHIQMNEVVDKKLSVEIMNAATGASVFKTTSEETGNQLDIHIPGTIASGSYLVKVVAPDGKAATGEIIIIK